MREFGIVQKEILMVYDRFELKNSLLAAVVFCAWTTSSLSLVKAQELIEADAATVLSSMSKFMGGLEKFSANYDADFDIITPDGQKLKLAGSGELLVARPEQFHITRSGSIADVDFSLDAGILTIYGKKLDGYIQMPAETIDDAITTVRDDIGFDAPGADIISAKPFDMDLTDIVSGRHIGMTTIGGISVHHLAFRGNQIDWQLWVKDGSEPLLVKYVITSKLQAGAPEYSMRISNWNTAPDVANDSFVFTPPQTAKKLSSIFVDETGQIFSSEE